MNNPSSLHLYAYCASNPINYVDPNEHYDSIPDSEMMYMSYRMTYTNWLGKKKTISRGNKKNLKTELGNKYKSFSDSGKKVTVRW